MTQCGNRDESSVKTPSYTEQVHCTVQELEDLEGMAYRASSIKIDRDHGRVAPPMTLFGRRLQAIAVTSRKFNTANCVQVQRSQLESLYWQICQNFGVHVLAGKSSDEDILCLVFTDPSVLEYKTPVRVGNVVEFPR